MEGSGDAKAAPCPSPRPPPPPPQTRTSVSCHPRPAAAPPATTCWAASAASAPPALTSTRPSGAARTWMSVRCGAAPVATAVPTPPAASCAAAPEATSGLGKGEGLERGGHRHPNPGRARAHAHTHGPVHTFTYIRVHGEMGAVDFPGGPVVKTLRFHCRGRGFDPGRGDPKIPHATHAAWPKQNQNQNKTEKWVQRPSGTCTCGRTSSHPTWSNCPVCA